MQVVHVHVEANIEDESEGHSSTKLINKKFDQAWVSLTCKHPPRVITATPAFDISQQKQSLYRRCTSQTLKLIPRHEFGFRMQGWAQSALPLKSLYIRPSVRCITESIRLACKHTRILSKAEYYRVLDHRKKRPCGWVGYLNCDRPRTIA